MKKQLQEPASSVVSRLEPSEKDDLISRKALMQRLHDAGGCGAPPESWADGYDKAIDLAYGMAENAPTLDPVTAAAEALGVTPDRLRELAQADREGRLRIVGVPKGACYGTCRHFEREAGTAHGACKPEMHNWVAQSRTACKAHYAPNSEAALDAMGGRKQCLKYAR